jgi:hypothetical protein
MPSFIFVPADNDSPLTITVALAHERMAKRIGAQMIERVRISETLSMAVDESGAIPALNRPVNWRASILYGVRVHGHPIHGDALVGVEVHVGFGANAGIDWVDPVNPAALLIRVASLIAERDQAAG